MINRTCDLIRELHLLDAEGQSITCIIDPFWSDAVDPRKAFAILDVVPSDQGILLVLANAGPEPEQPPSRELTEEERLAYEEQLADETSLCPQCFAPL
jgi:hypothetical protein